MSYMAKKGKMAAVGERDAVLAFQAMGMAVHPTQNAKETSAAIHKLVKEEYAVIFITEQAAAQVPETLSKYQTAPTPAIIPIPGSKGSSGLGLQRIRANVEKAIGADILFQKEGG